MMSENRNLSKSLLKVYKTIEEMRGKYKHINLLYETMHREKHDESVPISDICDEIMECCVNMFRIISDDYSDRRYSHSLILHDRYYNSAFPHDAYDCYEGNKEYAMKATVLMNHIREHYPMYSWYKVLMDIHSIFAMYEYRLYENLTILGYMRICDEYAILGRNILKQEAQSDL